MAEETAAQLKDLGDKPFELLLEMERRSRLNLAGVKGGDEDSTEWVGIGCLLGEERFLIARTQVREVMIMPPMVTMVPGSKDWVAGLANLRGQLLPVVDLRQFLGAGSSRGMRTARVLVVEGAEYVVGVIVDEVFGFRRFIENEFTTEAPETVIRCARYLDGACVRGADIWPVFSMSKLLDSVEFQQAAA
jgi:twitching motility protein PilI